jgi:hypothetical protein
MQGLLKKKYVLPSIQNSWFPKSTRCQAWPRFWTFLYMVYRAWRTCHNCLKANNVFELFQSIELKCSGMAPLIRACLTNLIGEEAHAIDIISNDVQINPGGKYKWNIQYRHPSRLNLNDFLRSTTDKYTAGSATTNQRPFSVIEISLLHRLYFSSVTVCPTCQQRSTQTSFSLR